jgi:membrane-associated phospholipid phosphatase
MVYVGGTQAKLRLVMRIRSWAVVAVVAVVAHLAPPMALVAQSTARDSAPPPAFSMVETKRFLGVLALGGIAYTLDERARSAVRATGAQESSVGEALQDVGDTWGDPVAISLAYAMWGGGYVTRRPTIAASGLRAVEAIAVSGTVTQLLKWGAGRARPFVSTNGRNDWQLGRGARERGHYESFPSGHATASFAFAAAVTGEVALRRPEHARWVGISTYGLATASAYARMHGDKHWLSDVTVGAGIGTVTAMAITRWHATRPDNVIDRWLLRPEVSQSQFGDARIGVRLTPPRAP